MATATAATATAASPTASDREWPASGVAGGPALATCPGEHVIAGDARRLRSTFTRPSLSLQGGPHSPDNADSVLRPSEEGRPRNSVNAISGVYMHKPPFRFTPPGSPR